MKKMDLRQFAVWTAALVVGAVLGSLGVARLDGFFNFLASAYTRLFQFVAVPTIALAVATTLASLGAKKSTGRLFLHTISYTLLTTLAAALVGLGLYVLVAPGNLPPDVVAQNAAAAEGYVPETLYGHILNVIPNNAVRPFFEGNVLSILFVAAAVGLGLAATPASEGKSVVEKGLFLGLAVSYRFLADGLHLRLVVLELADDPLHFPLETCRRIHAKELFHPFGAFAGDAVFECRQVNFGIIVDKPTSLVVKHHVQGLAVGFGPLGELGHP